MKFGTKVWYANRKNKLNAEIAEYNLPIQVVTKPNYFTVMSASTGGYLAITQYGEMAENTWNIVANAYLFGDKIKAGDVMWLDGEYPISEIEKQYGNGSSATAEVKSVAYVNRTIVITAQRNQKQVKE